jgi:hypothetical protein
MARQDVTAVMRFKTTHGQEDGHNFSLFLLSEGQHAVEGAIFL